MQYLFFFSRGAGAVLFEFHIELSAAENEERCLVQCKLEGTGPNSITNVASMPHEQNY